MAVSIAQVAAQQETQQQPPVSMSPQEPTDLDILAHSYAAAKYSLDVAKKLFNEAEVEIIKYIESHGGMAEEGATTHLTGFYKVSATAKINRTYDEKNLKALIESKVIPEAIAERLVSEEEVTILKVSLKELRYIQKNEPDLYAVIAQTITATPGKTTVKVEVNK